MEGGRTEAKKKELVFKSRKELEEDIMSVKGDRGSNFLKPKIAEEGRTEARKKELMFKSREELEEDIRSVRGERGSNILKPKIAEGGGQRPRRKSWCSSLVKSWRRTSGFQG